MDTDDAINVALCAALAYVVYDNTQAMSQQPCRHAVTANSDAGKGEWPRVCAQVAVEEGSLSLLPKFQDTWAHWRRQWGIWPNDLGNVGNWFSNDSDQRMRQQMV
jgi:hypothetical protein